MKDIFEVEAKLDAAFGAENWIIGKAPDNWFAFADWNSETDTWRCDIEVSTMDEALNALLEYAESLEVS